MAAYPDGRSRARPRLPATRSTNVPFVEGVMVSGRRKTSAGNRALCAPTAGERLPGFAATLESAERELPCPAAAAPAAGGYQDAPARGLGVAGAGGAQ